MHLRLCKPSINDNSKANTTYINVYVYRIYVQTCKSLLISSRSNKSMTKAYFRLGATNYRFHGKPLHISQPSFHIRGL